MIWKNIKGYGGEFQISERAEVRRCNNLTKETHIIKPQPAGKNKKLLTITLRTNNERKIYMLHNLYIDAFSVSKKEAYRIIYEGFYGDVKAKQNIQKWIKEKITECEDREKQGINCHDELLYLNKFRQLVV